MKLKDPLQFSRWQFYCQSPDGTQIKLPIDSEYAASQEALYGLVFSQFDSFGNEYKTQISLQAAKLNMTYTEYVKKSIEHQICLRNAEEELCWEDGFGDEIHSFLSHVDDMIESAPKILKVVGKAVTSVSTLLATGKAQKNFRGCSTCGGTRTFVAAKNNLGRAGAVNNYVPNTTRRNRI